MLNVIVNKVLQWLQNTQAGWEKGEGGREREGGRAKGEGGREGGRERGAIVLVPVCLLVLIVCCMFPFKRQ